MEPQSDVTVMVQLLDENGLADASTVTVVHFSGEGSEVLDSSEVENSSTTFQVKSFSPETPVSSCTSSSPDISVSSCSDVSSDIPLSSETDHSFGGNLFI